MPVTLCTLQDVRNWLKLGTVAGPDDDFINDLITAASTDFLQEIKRPDFYPAASYTEVREGDGGDKIVLRHWPINSVASVNLVTDYGSPPAYTEIPESTTDIAAGWYFDTDVDPERRYELFMDGRTFVFTDLADYVINYNAGYETVPADASQAVAYWAAHRYKSQQWIGQTQQHMAQGETTSTPESEIPPQVKRVIERYRRFDPLQVPPERVPLLDMSKRLQKK